MKNSGSILSAFLIGAGIGAVAGLLLAPEKGSDTRKKLVKGAQDLVENLKHKALELKEELEHPGDLEHRNRQEFYEKAFAQDVNTVV